MAGPKRAQSGEDAESLIEGLQPHPNLKELSVEGYGGVRFPSWMKNYGLSLPNLITINLERCSGCQILPSFAELPHLKSLELDGMEKVKYMECSSEGPFFPSLQCLKLNLMPELKEFWMRDLPTEPCPSFPCLSELTIWGCFNLTSVALPSSPLLSQLDIKFCNKLASLELHSSPCLSSLEIWVSPKLTFLKVPSLTCLKTLKLLGVKEELLRRMLFTASSLESLSIAVVDDMRTLPDELLQHVSTLQTLNIWNCPNFTAFPHWIGGFSSLRMLKIYKCPKLTSLPEEMPSLNSLQRTVVSDCLNLEKSVQEETVEDRPQIDFIYERMNEIGFHVRSEILTFL